MENDHDKLTILNNVYNNTIIQDKIDLVLPNTFKTPLYPHQLSLLKGMHMHREKMVRGFLVDNEAINGKLGILGDPSGTGKTLSVLAYLATSLREPQITTELAKYSSTYFFSHHIQSISDKISSNLIIVPQNMFTHWQHQIEQHTELQYLALETKRQIKGDELKSKIKDAMFVLTTDKAYRALQIYCSQNNIIWNNVFIDEATTIYINSRNDLLEFQFMWLITNHWYPLILSSPSINKSSLFLIRNSVKIHPELEGWLMDNITERYEQTLTSHFFFKDIMPFSHPHRGLLVVRNSYDSIRSSINIPNYIHQIVECCPSITLYSLLSYFLSKGREISIRSERIPYLFQALKIDHKEQLEYLSLHPENRHSLIKDKIQENECIICFDKCEYPTIVDCCYRVYCGKCILRSTLLTNRCPTCREPLPVDNMTCMFSLERENIPIMKPKLNWCLAFLEENKGGNHIIYCEFDNIYYQMFEDIERLGIKAERLESTLSLQRKTIKNFKNGITTILFVSNVEMIRGMSLSNTTHIIFYQKQPAYEQKEILISSAQQIGRKTPLTLVYLNSEIQV
jgi:SNF2 family DNA or RNA helicase